MIVYVEWQSCAWKTTLIDKLTNKYSNIHTVRELPIWIEFGGDINELCKSNDIDKIKQAKFLDSENTLVLVDRSYLSSMCYNYLKYLDRWMPEFNKEVERFYVNKSKWLLPTPDLYIYMTIGIECSKERVIKTWRKDRFRNILALREFYEFYFKYLEIKVPVFRIDWEYSISDIEKELLHYLNETFNFLPILYEWK